MSIVRARLTLLVSFAATSCLFAQTPDSSTWDRWQFLLGNWEGEGGGDPGQGTGGFTFKVDLQQRIIVRTNWTDYPATKNQPAFRHEDLMVVYREAGTAEKAMYWDSEGHVIRYTVEFAPEGGKVVFTSDSLAQSPRYRLTYVKEASDRVRVAFEIAPPGNARAFSPYIVAQARRR